MDTREKNKLITLLKNIFCWFSRSWDILFTVVLIFCMAMGSLWSIYRTVSVSEAETRQHILQTAQSYLGYNESDRSHEIIIDLYNTLEPAPREYKVSYDDNWCATFSSAVALEADFANIIPMECSCEQQINLFKELGCWREDECYLPRTGDYIYYVWDEWRSGDCTAWADHVGIVAETFGPVIKVIEGNKDDAVGYRYIFLNDICIRGYGLPDYKNAVK